MNTVEFVTRSEAMRKALEQAEHAARHDVPILLTGETGSGKNFLARHIHAKSSRAAQPFVEVDLTALSESIIEAELFGHERGAFTGAVAARAGRIEGAGTGTLLLDEIGDILPAVQAKLLRLVETGEFYRLGEDRARHTQARLIFSTNRNLENAVRDGRFREDLYYRVRQCKIRVPPLRERKEDIPDLVSRFVAQFNAELGKRITGVSGEVMSELTSKEWPGNVRQLRNVIREAMTYLQAGEIGLEHLPGSLVLTPPRQAPKAPPPPLKEIEREHIRRVLAYASWNKTQAASLLGITRTTLDRKIQEYGIAKP